MIGYAAAVPGRLQNQAQLVADPWLPIELRECGRPQRRLGGPLVRIAGRPDQLPVRTGSPAWVPHLLLATP